MLTVLDFVGQQRQEFRFDIRYGASTGVRRKPLAAQVEQGFPYLPAGAQILLDRVTQEQVLERLVRVLGSTALATYLTDTQADLADVYRNGSWSGLVRDAGLPWPDPGRSEAALLRHVHALLHVDDAERVTAYTSLLSAAAPVYDDLPGRDQT